MPNTDVGKLLPSPGNVTARKDVMKTKNTQVTLAVALIFVFALITAAQEQTETKCDTSDKDCPASEKEAVTADRDDVKPSIAETKYETLKFVPDSRGFAVKRPKADRPTEAADARDSASSIQDDPAAQAKPASNGTNPAELITRIEVKYQYQNFAAGDIHGIAIVRGDYAFTPKVSFRMDLPILHFDSKTPGLRSESGIGDIVTSMTFVHMFSKKFVGAFVPRIDFPTATDATLGSGKYAFKPVLAGVTPLAKGLALVGVLEYRVSFAGNQNRSDINELSIKPIILKSFLSGPLKGFYANPQLEFIVDFETNNRTTTQLGVNLGKVLSKNVVVFVIPTIHVAGTKRESFKLEIGFRYLFR
jgi:hypothetical protein